MSNLQSLLHDFALSENETPVNESVENIDSGIYIDGDNTPAIKAEDPTAQIDDTVKDSVADELMPPTMSADELEELENKIEENDFNLTEAAVDTFNEYNEMLYRSVAELEAISIKAIHEQAMILSESGYGSDIYNEKTCTLIEATSENIFQKIISWIATIIEKAKKLLSDLGISISMSFVDYEKFVTENEKKLMDNASEFGDRCSVKVHKWSDDILRSIDFRSMYNVVEDYVPETTDKDKMRDIINKCAEFTNVGELSAALYCLAFSEIIPDANIDAGDYTNKLGVQAAFKAKMRNNEKERPMSTERTRKYCNTLKNFKTNSSQTMSTMRHSINPDLDKLMKTLKSEINKRLDEGKDDTTKTQYYRLRYAALAAVQEAVNDALRIKQELIRAYGREMYNALKTLKSFNEDSQNEAIDVTNIVEVEGYTLQS